MRNVIITENAPAPIGPYNQAILYGNLLFTSGQIALNPLTMELIIDDIETETKLVMENLKAVLQAANMTFENVIKASIFIIDMDNFGAINKVYGSYFNEANAPARETVQVAGLPRGVNIEISMIAGF